MPEAGAGVGGSSGEDLSSLYESCQRALSERLSVSFPALELPGHDCEPVAASTRLVTPSLSSSDATSEAAPDPAACGQPPPPPKPRKQVTFCQTTSSSEDCFVSPEVTRETGAVAKDPRVLTSCLSPSRRTRHLDGSQSDRFASVQESFQSVDTSRSDGYTTAHDTSHYDRYSNPEASGTEVNFTSERKKRSGECACLDDCTKGSPGKQCTGAHVGLSPGRAVVSRERVEEDGTRSVPSVTQRSCCLCAHSGPAGRSSSAAGSSRSGDDSPESSQNRQNSFHEKLQKRSCSAVTLFQNRDNSDQERSCRRRSSREKNGSDRGRSRQDVRDRSKASAAARSFLCTSVSSRSTSFRSFAEDEAFAGESSACIDESSASLITSYSVARSSACGLPQCSRCEFPEQALPAGGRGSSGDPRVSGFSSKHASRSAIRRCGSGSPSGDSSRRRRSNRRERFSPEAFGSSSAQRRASRGSSFTEGALSPSRTARGRLRFGSGMSRDETISGTSALSSKTHDARTRQASHNDRNESVHERTRSGDVRLGDRFTASEASREVCSCGHHNTTFEISCPRERSRSGQCITVEDTSECERYTSAHQTSRARNSSSSSRYTLAHETSRCEETSRNDHYTTARDWSSTADTPHSPHSSPAQDISRSSLRNQLAVSRDRSPDTTRADSVLEGEPWAPRQPSGWRYLAVEEPWGHEGGQRSVDSATDSNTDDVPYGYRGSKSGRSCDRPCSTSERIVPLRSKAKDTSHAIYHFDSTEREPVSHGVIEPSPVRETAASGGTSSVNPALTPSPGIDLDHYYDSDFDTDTDTGSHAAYDTACDDSDADALPPLPTAASAAARQHGRVVSRALSSLTSLGRSARQLTLRTWCRVSGSVSGVTSPVSTVYRTEDESCVSYTSGQSDAESLGAEILAMARANQQQQPQNLSTVYESAVSVCSSVAGVS